MRLLLDANLLCLLAVGLSGNDHIARHKRTRQYTATDYVNIFSACNRSHQVVVCAHVLAEASNLVTFGCDGLQAQYLGNLLKLMEAFEETNCHSTIAAQRPEYLRLGLADAVLLELSKTHGLLLTADLKLYLAAASAGHRTVNYNHVIDGSIQMEEALTAA